MGIIDQLVTAMMEGNGKTLIIAVWALERKAKTLTIKAKPTRIKINKIH